MSDDREILREIWEGHIPVTFTLSPDEVASERPEPFYLMVSRQTYFPLVTDKVCKHLTQYVDKDDLGEMWLEYEGQPLKWHYPAGLLYDLHGGGSLPWKLTIHFKDFPEDELLHCPSKEVVESHYMSVVKEADALKHRSHLINDMQKKDHKQMWSGITNDKFDQFWPVNKRLMETAGDDMFRYIPFRIYTPDGSYFQKLFKPFTEEGHENTLHSLLQFALPESAQGDLSSLRVVIQGIEPPLGTSILWLSEHFSYPDNFLHICVHSPSAEYSASSW